MNTTLRISCSSLGKIMTLPRSKKATELSETAKNELLRIWIANTYGKHKEFTSKYTDKGNKCEEQGITMFSKHIGYAVLKNEERFYGSHLEGTPDLVDDDFIADIKCPWDLENFIKACPEDYEEQVRGYMQITGRKKAYLAYCLIDAPEYIIQKEVWKIQNSASPDITPEEIEQAVRENMTFDNVPKRIKVYEFNHDDDIIKKYHDKIELCREHYNSLQL